MDVEYLYKDNTKRHRIVLHYDAQELADAYNTLTPQAPLPSLANASLYLPVIDNILRRFAELGELTYGEE